MRPLVGISRSQKTGTVATRNSKKLWEEKEAFFVLGWKGGE